MNPGSVTNHFLRRQRRRSRGTLLAWAAAAAVCAPAWDGAARLGWIGGSTAWALLPAAAAAYLLIRWCRRVWRLDERALAREFDVRWGLRGRIESAVELAGGESDVAVAQRVDTERSLESRQPVGTAAWVGGIAAVLLCLGVIGLEKAAFIRRARQPAIPPPVAAAKPAPVVPAAPPPPPEPLRASLAWKSPARSIKAKAVGAIPLLAHAESNKGFRGFSLEVAVNGSHTNSYPAEPGASGALAQPGAGDLKLSLFLDESGAKPYDIVSYYLRGDANLPPDFPAVLSPLQFVEVLPVDPNPAGDEHYPADARELLRRLNGLKEAQVGLIEQNFELIHSGPVGIDPDWMAKNSEAASAQSRLAQTTDDARAFAMRIHASPLIAADLAQAAPPMTQAGAKIASQDNAAAAPLQAQALALLAATERDFRLALKAQSSAATPVSFRARQPAGLKPRGETPAGRLEQLARRQRENNQRLGQAAPGSPEYLAAAADQAAIARDVEKLAGERALVPLARNPLDAAAKAANEAARQLGLNDAQAAREPAAEAQASLQHAVEAQESEGRKAAAAVLEQVRQELNEADRLKDQTAQKTQKEQARQELSSEAERQQRQGSAQAAQKLDSLARQLGQPPQPGAKPAQSPQPSSPPADAPAGADQSSQGQGDDDDQAPPFYEAVLRPLEGASSSSASGTGTIMIRANRSTARVDVLFKHLSSEETAARLMVGGTGRKGTPAFELGAAQVTNQRWAFQPIGRFSSASLQAALKSGNLYVEIDSTAYRGGELGGRFLPQSKGGGGKGSGSGSGGSDSSSGGGGGGSTGDQEGSRPGGGRQTGSNRTPIALVAPLPDDSGQDVPPGSLIDASVTAAETEASLSPDDALAQTIRQLKSAAARLDGTASVGASSLPLLELAAQEARWLTGDARLADTARDIAQGAGGDLHGGNLDPAELKALADHALKLAQALEQAQSAAKRDEWVRRFAPEDIDPDYRKPVEDYFESLSREGAAR